MKSASLDSTPAIEFISNHVIIFHVNSVGVEHSIACVYASTSYIYHCWLYGHLVEYMSRFRGNCLMVGDFNGVLGSHEQRGNILLASSCRHFWEFIDNCELVEVTSTRPFFTWCNGRHGTTRVGSRLDRALVNTELTSLWDRINCIILPWHQSDHHLLLLRCYKGDKKVSRFRFLSMWLDHPDLKNVIQAYWTSSFPSLSPMQLLYLKMKTLRSILRCWNWEVFGQLEENINKCKADLVHIQLDISTNGISESLHTEELAAHEQLDVHLRRKETFSPEKSRASWLQLGDRNT